MQNKQKQINKPKNLVSYLKTRTNKLWDLETGSLDTVISRGYLFTGLVLTHDIDITVKIKVYVFVNISMVYSYIQTDI